MIMKKTLLSALVVFGLGSGLAQSDIIAVSGENQKAISFQDFRFLDLKGENDKLIINKSSQMPEQVVGMSYDSKNQQVIMIGMYSPDIYTYSLNSGEIKRVYATGVANSRCELPAQFSRMATASDGITYALNNGSTQLVEIKPLSGGYAVKELGALNSEVKLNQYKFYGGDLIADTNGDLYLISAKAQVVKINPKEMSATFVGSIQGLEPSFTTNGSAVMSNGKVLLSNAQGKGFYTLEFESLKAEKMASNSKTPIYDLASPYFLEDFNATVASNSFVSIYPTKVTDRNISVAVNTKLEGNGQVLIYDLIGNELIKSTLNLSNVNTSKTLTLNNLSPGNYIIKVIDAKGVELINEKFILLR